MSDEYRDAAREMFKDKPPVFDDWHVGLGSTGDSTRVFHWREFPEPKYYPAGSGVIETKRDDDMSIESTIEEIKVVVKKQDERLRYLSERVENKADYCVRFNGEHHEHLVVGVDDLLRALVNHLGIAPIKTPDGIEFQKKEE